MAEHKASTQAAHPWRATIRTAVQVGIPAFVGLLLILPPILQTIVDGFGRHLPPGVTAWLVAAAVAITAVSATLARIAALPGVLAWTARYLPWLSPEGQKPPKEALQEPDGQV